MGDEGEKEGNELRVEEHDGIDANGGDEGALPRESDVGERLSDGEAALGVGGVAGVDGDDGGDGGEEREGVGREEVEEAETEEGDGVGT